MNANVKVCLVLAMLVAVTGATSVATAALIEDNFNRPNNFTVGSTSATGTEGAKVWAEFEPLTSSNRIDVNGTRLVQGYYSPSPDNGVAVSDFTIANAIIEVTTFSLRTGTNWSTINYRGEGLANARSTNVGNAYRVVLGDTNNINLRYGTTQVATSSVTWTDGDVLKVTFNGNSHIVELNGSEIINFTETTAGRTGAGYVGLAVRYSWIHWDDYSVSLIPEPASLGLMGLGGLMMLGRRRQQG